MSLSLITVNVGAPSIERAHRQLRWLAGRPEDVLVLTETKASAGSQFLAGAFAATGYSVTFPEHAPGELGVMIVSKLDTTVDRIGAAMDYLPARLAGVVVDTTNGPLRIVGAYVPSRDATLDKTERKKTWIERFRAALDTTASDAPLLLLGDLNVLEPAHKPAHRGQFAPFEYGFYTGLTQWHGLVDLFRYLHPERVEHSWARVHPRDQGRDAGRLPAHRPFGTRRAGGADCHRAAANVGPHHGGQRARRADAVLSLGLLLLRRLPDRPPSRPRGPVSGCPSPQPVPPHGSVPAYCCSMLRTACCSSTHWTLRTPATTGGSCLAAGCRRLRSNPPRTRRPG